MKYSEFLKSVQTRQVQPVLTFFGEEAFLKDRALEAVLTKFLEPENRAFNFRSLYSDELKSWPSTPRSSRIAPAKPRTRRSRISPLPPPQGRSRPAPPAAPIASPSTTSCSGSRRLWAARPGSPGRKPSDGCVRRYDASRVVQIAR